MTTHNPGIDRVTGKPATAYTPPEDVIPEPATGTGSHLRSSQGAADTDMGTNGPPEPTDAVPEPVIDAAHIDHQARWSEATFGPGPRTAGVIDHIRKELAEVEADPLDLREWVDVLILAIDGAWRSGHTGAEIITAVKAKQARNEARAWPDWRTAPTDRAIEHVRDPAPEPDEGDVQRVAEAIYAWNDRAIRHRPRTSVPVDLAPMAGHILAALDLPARDARVAAAAWYEGFTRGFYDVLAGGASWDASESTAINPYRADEAARGPE